MYKKANSKLLLSCQCQFIFFLMLLYSDGYHQNAVNLIFLSQIPYFGVSFSGGFGSPYFDPVKLLPTHILTQINCCEPIL